MSLEKENVVPFDGQSIANEEIAIKSKEVAEQVLNIDLILEKLEPQEARKVFNAICEIENIESIHKTQLNKLFNCVYDTVSFLVSIRAVKTLELEKFKDYLNLNILYQTYKDRKDLPVDVKKSLEVFLTSLDGYDKEAFSRQPYEAQEEFSFLSKYLLKLVNGLSAKKLKQVADLQEILQKINKDVLQNETEEVIMLNNFIKTSYFNNKLRVSDQEKLLADIKQTTSVPVAPAYVRFSKNILEGLVNKDETLLFGAIDEYVAYHTSAVVKLDLAKKMELFFSREVFPKYQKYWNNALVDLILSHNENQIFINFMKRYEIPFNVPLFPLHDNASYLSILEYCLSYNVQLLEDITKEETDLFKPISYEANINNSIKKVFSSPLTHVNFTERHMLALIRNNCSCINDFRFKDLLLKRYELAFVKLYESRKKANPDVPTLVDDSCNLLYLYLDAIAEGFVVNPDIIDIFSKENFKIGKVELDYLKTKYDQLSPSLEFNKARRNISLIEITKQLLPLVSKELKESFVPSKDVVTVEILAEKNDADQFTVQWFSPGQIITSIKASSGGKNKILKEIIDKQPIKKPLVRIENENFFSTLEETMPNFKEVINYYKGQFRQNFYSNKSRMTPVLLLGQPGIGKTHFAKNLAKYLKTGYTFVDMGSITSGWVLSGSNGSWQDARHGRILEAMINSPTFNPIMLLDEIDKTHGGSYDPLAPFYQLLEEVNAREFTDEFTEMKFNASGIIYIACANSINNLPEPLLSRFKVFDVPSPTSEQLDKIIQNIYSLAIDNNPLISPELSPEVTQYLKDNSLREVKVILDDGISSLMLEHSREEIDKLRSENRKLVLNIEHLKEKKTKTKVGF